MRNLEFYKNGLHLQFCIDDEGRLLIEHVGLGKHALNNSKFFVPTEVFVTGENPDDHHGAKHTGGSVLKYESHSEEKKQSYFCYEQWQNQNNSALRFF